MLQWLRQLEQQQMGRYANAETRSGITVKGRRRAGRIIRSTFFTRGFRHVVVTTRGGGAYSGGCQEVEMARLPASILWTE